MGGGRPANAQERPRRKARNDARANASDSSDDAADPDAEAFNAVLRRKGLFVRDVASDGSCLFRAVSDQLYGDQHSHHEELRAKCVAYMRAHPASFAPFIEDSHSFDSYVAEIEKDSVWGGNVELQALSMALALDVRIHQVGAPVYDIRNDHGRKARRATPIHLSYHDGQHYGSVRRMGGDKYERTPASHPPLSTPAGPPHVPSASPAPEPKTVSPVLAEARERAGETERIVARALRQLLSRAAAPKAAAAGAPNLSESESHVKPRTSGVGQKARRALELEASVVRDLTSDAVKRAACLDVALQAEVDDDQARYDKALSRSRRRIYQLLDVALCRAMDLEDKVSSLGRPAAGGSTDGEGSSKRPSKKKVQQAKVRDRKARRLREQERAAQGDIPAPPPERNRTREVAI
jgi:hypothetical protein